MTTHAKPGLFPGLCVALSRGNEQKGDQDEEDVVVGALQGQQENQADEQQILRVEALKHLPDTAQRAFSRLPCRRGGMGGFPFAPLFPFPPGGCLRRRRTARRLPGRALFLLFPSDGRRLLAGRALFPLVAVLP